MAVHLLFPFSSSFFMGPLSHAFSLLELYRHSFRIAYLRILIPQRPFSLSESSHCAVGFRTLIYKEVVLVPSTFFNQFLPQLGNSPLFLSRLDSSLIPLVSFNPPFGEYLLPRSPLQGTLGKKSYYKAIFYVHAFFVLFLAVVL